MFSLLLGLIGIFRMSTISTQTTRQNFYVNDDHDIVAKSTDNRSGKLSSSRLAGHWTMVTVSQNVSPSLS